MSTERTGTLPGWAGATLLALLAAVIGFVAGQALDDEPTTRATTEGREASAARDFDPAAFDRGDPVERARRFLAMLDRLEAEDFPVVAERLHGRADEWAEFEARLFVWKWSQLDHVAAMAGALEWSRNLRDSVSYAAVRSWARVDPVAAQEAVRVELEDAQGSLGTSLLSGLAFGWAESGDIDGALVLVEKRFQSIVQRESVTEMVIEEMLRQRGVAASLAWAEELAGRHDDRAFLSIVFRKLGRNAVLIEPEATAKWLDAFEGHPSYMDRARRASALRWGRADPPAALAWMRTKAATRERRVSGLLTVLVDWVTRDADAALVWLRETPRDPVLDPAVARAAGQVARRSPREALAWVEHLNDAALRQQTLESVAAQWVASEPEEAAAWLRTADLSEEARKRIAAAASTPPRSDPPPRPTPGRAGGRGNP